MRIFGLDITTRTAAFNKASNKIVGDLEKLADIQLEKLLGDRWSRAVRIPNNQVYLSCGIRHFSKVVCGSPHQLNILKGFIDIADWSFLKTQTVPPNLLPMLEPKTLHKTLSNLLKRLDSKKGQIEDQICDIVGSQTVTAFALTIFMRSLTASWLSEHPQSQVIGNQTVCVGDYGIDARGTVLAALAITLDLAVIIIFMTGVGAYQYTKQSYCEDSEEKLEIVLGRNKCLLVEAQIEANKENKTQSVVDLLERRISRVDSEKKFAPHKNCNRCGRVKLEKFCVCRKLGQREISAHKQLAQSIVTSSSNKSKEQHSQMAAENFLMCSSNVCLKAPHPS